MQGVEDFGGGAFVGVSQAGSGERVGPSWGLQSATEIPAAAEGDCHGHGGNHLAKVSPARYVAHRRKERTSSKSKIVISFLFQSENS